MSRRRLFPRLDIMMLVGKHIDVRTTLTLDDDVAAKLRAEVRKTGRPFKETVNACLRAGLNLKKQARPTTAFRVRPYDMGVRPGVNLDKISSLLDELEGPEHR
jgi:hypothetical protein